MLIKDGEFKRNEYGYDFVCLDEFVPQDHLLRKIDKYIDFTFIYDLVEGLYCKDNGRPAFDPVVLFKMLFIGYLYGIRSERRLVKEIEMNIAYRWFLGFKLSDKIPDDSTISRNRNERFKGTDIFQKVFDNIVEQAIKYNLVGGKVLYTDSTHLKANANKKKFNEIEVEKTAKDYEKELNETIDKDRINHGKKSLKKNPFLPN